MPEITEHVETGTEIPVETAPTEAVGLEETEPTEAEIIKDTITTVIESEEKGTEATEGRDSTATEAVNEGSSNNVPGVPWGMIVAIIVVILAGGTTVTILFLKHKRII